MNELITAEDIQSAQDCAADFVDVPVPEWTPKALRDQGEVKKIRLQVMSAKEAIDFTKMSNAPGAQDEAILRVIQLCAVNGSGNKLFTAEQLTEIAKKSFKVLVRLQDEALKLNGFTKKAQAAQDAAVKKD